MCSLVVVGDDNCSCWFLLGLGSFCLSYVLCYDQQNCFPLAVLDDVLFVFSMLNACN